MEVLVLTFPKKDGMDECGEDCPRAGAEKGRQQNPTALVGFVS